MKKSKLFDICSYIVVLVFCATTYFITLGFTGAQAARTRSDPVGAVGFPRLLILLMAVLAIAGIVRAVLEKDGNDKLKMTREDFATLLKFAAALAAYIFMIPHVGYCVSTTLFAMFNMWWMGVRKTATIVITGVLLTVVLYVAFGVILSADLPSGFPI